MKATFNTLLLLFAFSCLSIQTKAQNGIPDSARLAPGIDIGIPAGNISGRYLLSLGASVRLDLPLSKKSYFTASVGYNNFFLANGSTATQEAILSVPVNMLQTLPLKLGYKLFLIKRFYVQVEGGTTLLLDKDAVYATKTYAFTYAPQFGFLFDTKNHHFIDAGVRYEGVSSFYNDKDKYSFWALHISYAFKL